MENNFDTQSYLDMELLRFTTAGSVDDGKSTLIGRLLYDSKSIFEDQVEQIEQTSNENYENVETKFAQVHEPVALPRTLDGRENFDNTDAPANAVPQYKTYDRLVYAPARSRTSYQGDYIRGDLPIMPDPNQCGWFKSQHARPETSLNVGAMSVLFGGHSDVAKMVGGAVSGHNAPTPEGVDQADGLVQRVQSNPQLSNISGSGGVGVVGFA